LWHAIILLRIDTAAISIQNTEEISKELRRKAMEVIKLMIV